jgi:hypothetical protein
MKVLYRKLILLFSLLATIGFSSCLEDKEDLYDKVGPVATIPVFSASRISSTTGQPVTGAIRAGDPIRLTVRFYSPNVAVRELVLNQTIANGEKQQIASRPVTGFDTNNSYVETFDYQIPADAADKRIVFEVVAATTNDLTNNRTLTLNIPK